MVALIHAKLITLFTRKLEFPTYSKIMHGKVTFYTHQTSDTYAGLKMNIIYPYAMSEEVKI